MQLSTADGCVDLSRFDVDVLESIGEPQLAEALRDLRESKCGNKVESPAHSVHNQHGIYSSPLEIVAFKRPLPASGQHYGE